MHWIRLMALVAFLHWTAESQGQYVHTVFPVGNLADVSSITAFAQSLAGVMDSIKGNQTLLFTGDIVNTHSDLKSARERLDTLLLTIAPEHRRKIIFLPGDRDWDDSGPMGWDHVQFLEEYIDGKGRPDVHWPLSRGCPGPEKIELDLALNLIAVNTQWWNHPYDKPIPESAVCEIATHEGALEEVEAMIEEAKFGNILIAGHYPVISGGVYGGHFPFVDWITPFPLIGTMITAHKQNVGSAREISNHRFAEYREDMEDLLAEYPSLIYCSGHEQIREIVQFHENILIQSGAPENGKHVKRSSSTLYASEEPGLVILQYDMEGNVWASTFRKPVSGFVFDQRISLLQAPCRTPLRGVPVNQRLVPCLDDQYVLPRMQRAIPQDTVVAANTGYAARAFKRFLLGEHYRKSWTTPVTTPFLNLDTTANGLIPYLEGGGRQTKSLRMAGEDGREYVFRSVDKDPSKALSYNLRESLISLIIRDQISTQHPYGALVSSELIAHLDILHPEPRLFVMPDDGKLGPFRETFGNMMGMLEERPSGRKEVQKTFGSADQVLGSSEMFRKLYQRSDHSIHVQEYARARMFDLLVGDWSKHEDNWKWAGFRDGDHTIYRPIPRDRDHVFSRWDGFLPWLADREWAKPQGENFDYSIHGLRSLMWQSRHLDRFVANELTKSDWIEAARYVQDHLSVSKVDSALLQFPEEVRSLDGPEIAAKLQARLSALDTYATDHYLMLAKKVDVRGTNEDELFDVIRNPDGSVDVTMRGFDDGATLYERHFLRDETQEIRLFGLRGNDVMRITGDAQKSILVRAVPGAGENTVIDSSQVRKGCLQTRIYSANNEDRISGGKESKQVRIPYEEAYYYRRTAFAYHTYSPIFYIWSSSGNGLLVTGGLTFTRQSYDKPDYSAIHRLSLGVSTLGNVRFEYQGRSRYMLGRWDMTYGTLLDKHRRLNYFFGTGNSTVLDPDLLANDFYTLQYSSLQFNFGLSRSFWDRSNLGFGLILKGTGRENQAGNILEPGAFPDVAGIERLRIAKGYLHCDFDFRDRLHLPRRGMRWVVDGVVAGALNDDATNYANVKSWLEYFTTLHPFTLGLKAGGAIHDGHTPFFDFHYLGQNTDLRGYRQNRFTGKRLAFFNSDLRIQFVENPRALIPYKLGLILFYDTGRVFDDVEVANAPGWHQGYGAGFYFVPIKEKFTLQVSLAFSKEESALLRFGLGQSF